MSQLNRRKWWIIAALATFPLIASGEDVPNTFVSGTVISSAKVNENFKNLADRTTALETALGAAAIPDIDTTHTTPGPEYNGATSVKLPIYHVVPGENGTNEASASCNGSDLLISGGCVVRDTTGSDACTLARSYPISANAWLCRGVKATGVGTECRASPVAICIKSGAGGTGGAGGNGASGAAGH